ncbi:L,D-transpeptidase [Sinisalibacter lacisalsi]|nr:L,D-transpeptidase [Sinisalibacter lacisalsi]
MRLRPPRGLALLLGLVALAACTEPIARPAAARSADELTAVIDISDQQVEVTRARMSGQAEVWRWPVSTGRPGYATPTGTFRPFLLSKNHRSSLYDDAPMPWSVFFNGDVAIHGSYEIADLGQPASHGCVRLHPTHAEHFFRQVQQVGMANTVISVVQ